MRGISEDLDSFTDEDVSPREYDLPLLLLELPAVPEVPVSCAKAGTMQARKTGTATSEIRREVAFIGRFIWNSSGSLRKLAV